MTVEHFETLVIGAGQAGLAMSHHLTKRGLAHLVVERGRIGERWHSERWDGMHFQTPNELVRLVDFRFPDTAPDRYATAAQIADFLRDYATAIAAPVRAGVAVRRLRRAGDGFVAETDLGKITAASVVIATGPFQTPKMPDLLAPTPGIVQLHASAYRAPENLPPGGVLVVGAGASGAQIAEELLRAGRAVFLSVSRHRRAPRRYRGHDHVWWWVETGLDLTPPERRNPDSAPVVHTGAYGGYTIDFRDFARHGMVLLGRAEAGGAGVLRFAPDLAKSLAQGDAAYFAFMDFVDAHIRAKGLDKPWDLDARRLAPAPPALIRDLAQPVRALDLRAAGIATVIWCTGYGLDFSWVDLPVLDPRGVPVHRRGVTDVPGLYFLGLPFLTKLASNFLFGVGDDAAELAVRIGGAAPGQGALDG